MSAISLTGRAACNTVHPSRNYVVLGSGHLAPNGPQMKKRTHDDFSTLMSFLDRVKSYTEDLIFIKDSRKALYHYTDLAGLQGILQNDDLWLTHSRYLNDDEEITHGYGIVKSVIEEEQKGASAARRKFLD